MIIFLITALNNAQKNKMLLQMNKLLIYCNCKIFHKDKEANHQINNNLVGIIVVEQVIIRAILKKISKEK